MPGAHVTVVCLHSVGAIAGQLPAGSQEGANSSRISKSSDTGSIHVCITGMTPCPEAIDLRKSRRATRGQRNRAGLSQSQVSIINLGSNSRLQCRALTGSSNRNCREKLSTQTHGFASGHCTYPGIAAWHGSTTRSRRMTDLSPCRVRNGSWSCLVAAQRAT